MPRSAFRLGTLVGEDDLVASAASRFESLSVMPATVESAVSPEVDEVYQQLSTDTTDEAGGMPKGGGTGPARCDRHLGGRDRPSAFPATGTVWPFELARVSTAEGLALPLRGEYTQFAFLLLGKAAAISRLVVVWR